MVQAIRDAVVSVYLPKYFAEMLLIAELRRLHPQVQCHRDKSLEFLPLQVKTGIYPLPQTPREIYAQ